MHIHDVIAPHMYDRWSITAFGFMLTFLRVLCIGTHYWILSGFIIFMIGLLCHFITPKEGET